MGQTNEEIKEVKLHKSVFLVMAATFFGNQRKQGMTFVTDNAPADPMPQGTKNAHNTDILCGSFHTGYC